MDRDKREVFGDGANILFPMFKEMFNIPVEDAIGAVKLFNVAAILLKGPGQEGYNVEEAPERVVVRWPKCVWMERYKEYEVEPAFIPCPEGHQAWNEEGLKAVNPKITVKLTKAMPWGDPYCEDVIEFKDE